MSNKLNRFLTRFFVMNLLLVAAIAQGANSFYDLEAKDIDGKTIPMKSYKGKVIIVVNTASQCGFTPQLKDLTELQSKYGSQGLQILAFPSNKSRDQKVLRRNLSH